MWGHVQVMIHSFVMLILFIQYVHSAGIIHRDLKPSNIAVNEDCELRVNLSYSPTPPTPTHTHTHTHTHNTNNSYLSVALARPKSRI